MQSRWLYKTVFQDFFMAAWEKVAVACSVSVGRKLGRRQQWRAVQVLAGNCSTQCSDVRQCNVGLTSVTNFKFLNIKEL